MDIVSYLLGKNSAGGGGGGKYAPNYILFRDYAGTDLEYETANLDTSNLTTMKDLFRNDLYLTTIDTSNWNTSSVADMQTMFLDCKQLPSVDVSNWNTSNVTNFNSMFFGCSTITTINCSNFDLSLCTNFANMFYSCSGATSIKIGYGNLNGDINLSGFVQFCTALTEIDMSGITFSNNSTINMQTTFNGCKNLMKIDIRRFDTSKITNNTNMLYRVPTNCLIIVGTDADKTWFATNFPNFTNVKTPDEL